MADQKISELTNITGANLANADEFVVVDASADQTKAITFGELKEAFDTGTGFVRITGDTMTGDLSFGDNDKAIFGAGSDLQIYHSGSNSYIKDAGVGNLSVQANVFRVYNAAGDELSANFVQNGAVTLYHDGAQKLSTTSTGVDVTGTVTADGLTVDGIAKVLGTAANTLIIADATETNGYQLKANTSASADYGFLIENLAGKDLLKVESNGDISFYEDTGTTPKFFWDASAESLGIGTSSPTEALEVDGKIYINNAAPDLRFTDTGTGVDHCISANSSVGNFAISVDENSEGAAPKFLVKVQGNSFFEVNEDGRTRFLNTSGETMRIDSSGNLLVGTTSITAPIANNAGAGITLRGSNGQIYAGGADTQPLTLNRETSDGTIAEFRKDGTAVGSIGTSNNYPYFGGTDTSLRYDNANNDIRPFNPGTLTYRDNIIDLGSSGARFDNIYATNGTIQTSDRNEKQDIEALSDAETRVAQACKGLLRKFRWKDVVAEKGDDARIHFGIIAQDLQDAFAAEGLDAGNYAMFISSTWWETQTDVPAVEAVEAVEATYDEDGNELTPAVEAVEAKEAYTRTDTYETLEEAPEGATERTRLGVRYPELLAFIIAAI